MIPFVYTHSFVLLHACVCHLDTLQTKYFPRLRGNLYYKHVFDDIHCNSTFHSGALLAHVYNNMHPPSTLFNCFHCLHIWLSLHPMILLCACPNTFSTPLSVLFMLHYTSLFLASLFHIRPIHCASRGILSFELWEGKTS